MKILFTGGGKGASWKIRGAQLSRAMCAPAIPNALDVSAYDLAVVVKRAPLDLVERIHRAGIPLVWDIVDAWPQPEGNRWVRGDCLSWLRNAVKVIRPAAIVAATRAMAADCAEFGLPVLALPHHAWPGQGSCVIAPKVQTVGYQGGAKYLGWWRAFMEAECARRGWRFVVNPETVASVDIAIAVREAGGYAPRQWKSNCKLANAQGCGTPFIGNRECGYLETASGRELWADTKVEMISALDELTPQPIRAGIAVRQQLAAPRLADVAKDYAAWLGTLV